MKSKTRKLLITGVALLIFGPVLGHVLFFVGMFYSLATTSTAVQSSPPGSIPDVGHMMLHMFMWLFVGFGPLLLGILAGATGFFLIIYSLITHFCKAEEAG
jgi:hypothetical protein